MIAFVPLVATALDQVLAWRTDPEITRYLLTDIQPDPVRQRAWFERVSADDSCSHWLIRQDDRYVGLASLTEIDRANRTCSCGFYVGEPDARHLGGLILPAIVNHVFAAMAFHKIHGVVMAGNQNVLDLHRLLNYREVGVLREHVLKYGRYHDVHVFELLRREWEQAAATFKPFQIPVLSAESDM